VKSGFVTLIGIVIAMAILAFVMIKVLSSTIQSRKNLDQSANPAQVQQQVDKYKNQLQQKQNQDINRTVD